MTRVDFVGNPALAFGVVPWPAPDFDGSVVSSEQARGKAVDKRADIWAFGCVLYEMVTGYRAFRGDDSSRASPGDVCRQSKQSPSWPSESLYFTFYNFGRVHQTLRVTPAMEAGIADHVWSIDEIVGLPA